jgi:thioredoxin reductase (NADPH)
MNSLEYKFDLIVVGNGVAGMAAGIYGGRYKLKTLIIGHEFGGETAKAGVIHNYPGAPHIDGFDLVLNMKKQAEDGGVQFLDGEVTSVKKQNNFFVIDMGDKKYEAKVVVLAVGTKRARLGLPNETELTSRGIHYCVTCDGPVYGGKTVAVIGGGDGAVKGVNLLAQYAKKIYLITRDAKLTAELVNIEDMKKLGDKVEHIAGNSVAEIVGKKSLEN